MKTTTAVQTSRKPRNLMMKLMIVPHLRKPKIIYFLRCGKWNASVDGESGTVTEGSSLSTAFRTRPYVLHMHSLSGNMCVGAIRQRCRQHIRDLGPILNTDKSFFS